jgi:hypothetical protein
MTAQIHELLLLDEEWTSMASEPPLPQGHPRVVMAAQEAQNAASPIIFSTACWRRYRGTWLAGDGRLSLIAIEGSDGARTAARRVGHGRAHCPARQDA